MKQGTRANYTGGQLEGFVANILEARGYTQVEQKKFEPSKNLNQPIYARQYYVENIYGSRSRVDFVLYHPVKHPKCLMVEAKWQESGGSIDEKFPYLVLNIKNKYPYKTIVVLDGEGYKRTVYEWLKSQVGDNFRALFSMSDFQKWANTENI